MPPVQHEAVYSEHSDLTGVAILLYLQTRRLRCGEKASSKFKELPRVRPGL